MFHPSLNESTSGLVVSVVVGVEVERTNPEIKGYKSLSNKKVDWLKNINP